VEQKEKKERKNDPGSKRPEIRRHKKYRKKETSLLLRPFWPKKPQKGSVWREEGEESRKHLWKKENQECAGKF